LEGQSVYDKVRIANIFWGTSTYHLWDDTYVTRQLWQ